MARGDASRENDSPRSPRVVDGWIRYEVRIMDDGRSYPKEKLIAFTIGEARDFLQSPYDVVVAIEDGIARSLTVDEE